MQQVDELIVRFRQDNDREALSEIASRYAGHVYNLTLSILGDADKAQDATQETFLNLIRKAAKYRPDTNFRAWISRIAVNCALKLRRGEQRRKHYETKVVANTREEKMHPSKENFPAKVKDAVLALPDELRIPVVLHYYHGLSYSESATALACPQGTVASRLHRAIEKLKKTLKVGGFGAFLGSLEKALRTTSPKPVPPALSAQLAELCKTAPAISAGADPQATATATYLKIAAGVAVTVVVSVLLILHFLVDREPPYSHAASRQEANILSAPETPGVSPNKPGNARSTDAGANSIETPKAPEEEPQPQSKPKPGKSEQQKIKELARYLHNRLVTLSLRDTPLEFAFMFMRDITGLTFIISENLLGRDDIKISGRLHDVPINEILGALCISGGDLTYRLTTRDGKPVVLITTPDEAEALGLKQQDFTNTTDVSSLKVMLTDYACPFGLPPKEFQRAQAVKEKLQQKVQIDEGQIPTTFSDIKSFIEYNLGLTFTIDNQARQLLEGKNPEIKSLPAELTCADLLKGVESSSGLHCLLSPGGVVVTSSSTYKAMALCARQYQMEQEVKSRTVTSDFINTPFKDVIPSLETSSTNIIVSAKATQLASNSTVTLQATGMPLEDALKQICRQAGLEYEIRDFYILIKCPGQ